MEYFLIIIFVAFLIISWSWYLFYNFRFLKSCKYKIKEIPGETCVICPHNKKCGRALKSKPYNHYRRIELLSPEKAYKIWKEIKVEKETY